MVTEHIKFTTIREGLSEFEVENGQLLKVMVVATDIFVEEKDGQKVPVLGLKELSAVITDVEIDTSGLEYADNEKVTENDELRELQFKPITQIVNIYESQNFIFLVPTIIRKVMITNKKDNQGNPILRFQYLPSVSTVDKSTLYGTLDTTKAP
jgi:hypothetical protein